MACFSSSHTRFLTENIVSTPIGAGGNVGYERATEEQIEAYGPWQVTQIIARLGLSSPPSLGMARVRFGLSAA